MRGKNIYTAIISIILSIVMATIPTLQTLADDSQNATEYISDVKIGVGKTVDEAAASLDGYTILKNGNDYADLNQGAGGGIGSKGDKVVLLGYKTTKSRTDAITDLAVMNMKGGYSVKDYELLMEQQMTEQIIPFVEGFLVAIEEYRTNYNSEDNSENKARAEYVHDALNKLTDDDCNDTGLGDLLLNETKYEMGDEAYEALSEEEKKEHADILTIIAQANGKATLIMENLITRAADTGEDSWIDRFTATTYDSLLELFPDMLPSDAEAELAKIYDDDAREILSMWDALKEHLEGYDEKAARYEELSATDISMLNKKIEDIDLETATDGQIYEYAEASVDISAVMDALASLYADITLKDYLETIEYGDGTLADFFMQDYSAVEEDITVLYPLVASLSDGQRAGLQFVTLADLVTMTASGSEAYKDADIDGLTEASIYENVDRGIYTKGGVALTSEALRTRSAEEVFNENGKISMLTYILYGVTAASAVAFGVAATAKIINVTSIVNYTQRIEDLKKDIKACTSAISSFENELKQLPEGYSGRAIKERIAGLNKELQQRTTELANEQSSGTLERLQARSPLTTKLVIGFGIVMVVMSAVSLYFTYRDLVDYYNVDYTPIPSYIVDEKDITAYNAKGEKIVIKNQAAYYKAVECNRAEGDEWYDTLGNSADLNGTVGRQWLALYAVKNESMSPIVADSLKVVADNLSVPAGYTTGIHMFGAGAAYNLNNTQLVWNNDAKSIFVYFKTEDELQGQKENNADPKENETDPEEETNASETKETEKETKSAAAETTAASKTPSTEGSGFSGGALALSGGIGLVVGALVAAMISMAMKKKKE